MTFTQVGIYDTLALWDRTVHADKSAIFAHRVYLEQSQLILSMHWNKSLNVSLMVNDCADAQDIDRGD